MDISYHANPLLSALLAYARNSPPIKQPATDQERAARISNRGLEETAKEAIHIIESQGRTFTPESRIKIIRRAMKDGMIVRNAGHGYNSIVAAIVRAIRNCKLP